MPVATPHEDAASTGGTGGVPPATDLPDSGSGGDQPGGTAGSEVVGQPDAAPDIPVTPLLPAGTACLTDDGCASGFCVDKVCCSTRCDGACHSCAVSGSVGTCLPADVGTDPRNDCADDRASSCGTDGTCDGLGKCRRYPAGTICLSASCVGSTLTASSRCALDGCVASAGQSCAPFMCGTGGACLKLCATDRDCVAPNTCMAGKCGKKPLGQQCEADAECNSSHCAQGICCGDACTGTCTSCAVTGSEGKCTPVPPGQDSLGKCARQEPATCGLDGTCDGAGACRSWGTATVCKAGGCAMGTVTPAAVCDGKGMCAAAAPISCGDYACDVSNARCMVGCTTILDCASPAICAQGVCGGILGKYFSDITLTNLVLTRTEPLLSNNWGAFAPPGGLVPNDLFSARYSGTVTSRFSETYTFYLNADDGVRMWVNDVLIIDDWNDHNVTESSGTFALRANQPAAIKIEYYENMGNAQITLSWSSPSEPKAIIPTGRLSPRM